uniref:Uncharacterized protein n=1 Tax=Brassica campestris TaxID=3711 RepID=M4CUK5_BRACM
MKGLGETQTGFRVGGVTNIAKKKNVFRETLKLLLKKSPKQAVKRNRDFIPGCSRNTRGWEEEHDRSDVEEVAEENLESVNSSVSYSDETNIWSLSFSCWTVEEVWRQCSRFQENKHPCIKNVEVKSDGVIGSCGHVYVKPVTDKLEEFRKASIAYVVMPLDNNTFQVAAPSGNDVWIVQNQMRDCTICTCGDFPLM